METDTVLAARRWINELNSGVGLNGAWKLQRLTRRSKVHIESSADSSSEVTVSSLPTRLRRFAKGLPWALVPEAVRYLHESMPYTGIIVNGVRVEEKYVATRTWWERDEGSIVDRGQQNEGTYTLYQDLIDKDHADEAEFESGGTCSEKIMSKYVFDAVEVPDVLNGGQGVTVSVQAISRSEDGLFNYAIVTRRALTQHSGKRTVTDDAFEKVELQTWDNVYTDGDKYVDDLGNELLIPKASDSGNGVLIEVTPRENPDCTFQITAKTTTSKPIITSKVSSATIFEVSKQRVIRSESSSGFSEIEEATDGKIRSLKIERRQDGKVDVTEESRTEQSVDEAVWEKRKTLRSVRVSKTDRNQPLSAIDDAKASVTKVGQSVRIEKTDGGRVNITFESVASESVGDLREECQKTVFLHTHSRTKNQKADPGDINAADASNGVVKTISKARTEDGTFDIVSESRVEQSVDEAVWEKRKTLRSVRVSKTDRNQPLSAIDDAKASVTKVGQSVRIEKTDGGRVNITFESVASESVGDLREECKKTAFLHTHARTKNLKSDPGDINVSDAANGKIVIRSKSRTEDGTFDIVSESQSEIAVAHSQRSESRDPFKTVVVYRDSAVQTDSDADGEFAPGFVDYDGTDHTPNKDGTDGKKTRDEYEITNGKMVNRVRTFTYVKERSWKIPEVSTNYMYSRGWCFRNYSSAHVASLVEAVASWFDAKVNGWVNDNRMPSTHSVEPNVTLNEYGRYDGSVTVSAKWQSGTAGQNGNKDCVLASLMWEYWSFDPINDRNYTTGPTSTWDGTWYAAKYTMIRVVGRGKTLLDKFSSKKSVSRPPNISYNPENGMWTLEALIYMQFVDRVTQTGFEKLAWTRTINNANKQDAPADGSASEPTLINEYG